jgi:hypothetical protein
MLEHLRFDPGAVGPGALCPPSGAGGSNLSPHTRVVQNAMRVREPPWYGENVRLAAASVTVQLGTAAIDFGVYGVPETYIVDGSGHIRYRHVGALGERDVNRKILPLIAKIAEAGQQRGADEQ